MSDWMACDETGLPVARIVSDAKTLSEEDWLLCDQHQTMLAFLVTWKASNRKLRLFACACCRRIWKQLKRMPSKRAVEVAEHYADGKATRKELAIAREEAHKSWMTAKLSYVQGLARQAATYTASTDIEQLAYTSTAAYLAVPQSGSVEAARYAAQMMERATHPHRLRCIFGNPYRPVSINPAWLTPAVTNLANAAYEERALPSGELDPARLAVLADALEEAGCHAPNILGHCRQPGEHVRGCWVVDSFTGRR